MRIAKIALGLLFSGFFMTAQAQEAIRPEQYLRVSAGYSYKAFTENLNDKFFFNTNLNLNSLLLTGGNGDITELLKIVNIEQINTSLGQGVNVDVGYGIMFNKTFGLDAGISALFGSDQASKMDFALFTSSSTLSANMFRFNPSIVIASDYEKFNIYSRFGLVLGYNWINYRTEGNIPDIGTLLAGGDSTGNFGLSNGTSVTEWKYSGNIATGFNAVLGAGYKIDPKFDIFAEFRVENVTYAPTTGKMTTYTVNGQNQLDQLSKSQKEINFKESTNASNVLSSYGVILPSSDPNQASEGLIRKYPFGSMGVQIGLKYKF